jgi:AsmA-like protein
LAGVGIEGGDLTVQVDDRTVSVEGETGLTGLPITVGRSRVAVAYVPSPGGSDDRLDIALEGSDLLAKGVATLDGRALRAVKVSRIRFGGNDVAVEVERLDSGGYHVSIDGANMDIEPFLHVRGPTAQLAETVRVPYDVAFSLQRVGIGKGVELSVVEGTARSEGGRFVAFNGSANLPGAGFVRVNLTEQGPVKRLEVASNRAGNLLKAAGILSAAEGGQLSLAATVDDRGEKARIDGQVEASDVRVTQAPIIARILSLGSLDGIASMLGGEGILVSRAQIPFTWSRDRLDVREATSVGAIGITVDGSVDQANRTVDLRGSVFPAYTLNSALGRIPFIGNFLVGGKGAGVFGIAYRVTGNLDNPNVEANPLSALAPGMLRRWFVDPFQRADDRPPEPQQR